MNNYAPTDISKEIASRLRGQIARYDVSQAELAVLCNVSQSQFSKIIRATRPMTVDQLATICDALAIDMGELLSSVETLIDNQGAHASALSYVDEEIRFDEPYQWSADMLDAWGQAALTRIANVPSPREDVALAAYDDEDWQARQEAENE